MGTAMYTGVTGLLAHQRRLDVVASNIANVNTVGYRGARVLFRDLFSQTIEGGRAPVSSFGGSNPAQIGLGVRLGTIDINFNQGALVTTGVASDLAIQGSGFFVLSNGSDMLFSRDGSFALNSRGELIDPATGLNVQGYQANRDGEIEVNAPHGNLVIPVGGTAIVRATENVTLIGNLNSNAAIGSTLARTIRVYDSLGTARDVDLTYTRRAQVDDGTGTLYNAWEWMATYQGTDVLYDPTGSAVRGVILFNPNGAVAKEGVLDAAGTFTERLDTDPSISVTAAAFGALPAMPDVPFDMRVDFSSVTELSAESDTTISNQDGFPRGVLESFNIGRNGSINGVFTNGLTRTIGQIATANFSNVAGLSRQGDNLFRGSPASGEPQIGLPNTGGRGEVAGGVLENSNVDLGTEFSNMIVTQRGFQANARTITAADTLLQETVNLAR